MKSAEVKIKEVKIRNQQDSPVFDVCLWSDPLPYRCRSDNTVTTLLTCRLSSASCLSSLQTAVTKCLHRHIIGQNEARAVCSSKTEENVIIRASSPTSVKWNDVLKLISVVSALNLINSLHQQLFFVNAEGEVLKHTSHTQGDVRGEGFIFWITFSFSSQTDDTKYSFHWSRAEETEREQLESNICCNAGSLIKEKTFYSVWKNP